MKTSELTGETLDAWVARCEFALVKNLSNNQKNWAKVQEILKAKDYRPSTNWAQGGPIIERMNIPIERHPLRENGWTANEEFLKKPMPRFFTGPTPLIAAMRCYVASKYGDEVPDA